MNKRTRSAAEAALAAGLGSLAYPLFFRRWCLTWGARPDEVSRKLPGDELLADPDIVSTRVITIDAPPAAIWPWLVQMGSGRGGVYTYDWIENLFGLKMHSARQILPEYQEVKVGDELPLGPSRPVMQVVVCDPERTLRDHRIRCRHPAVRLHHVQGGHDRALARDRAGRRRDRPDRQKEDLTSGVG